MLLKGLIESKVTVEVCPLVLPNKGLTPFDLIEGVSVAAPPIVAEGLLAPGIKLFTF
jgi:hypothetical protein